MVAMLVTAENATELPRLGNARMKLSVHASQTIRTVSTQLGSTYTIQNSPVRIGDLVSRDTLWKNLCPGMPPSRANAYIMRLLDVTENVPQKNIAPMTITCVHRQRARRGAAGEGAHHEHDRALLADGVEEDLRDGLAGRRADRACEILDGEQQAEEEEPAEHGGHADGHDDPDGACHGCVVRLLCHLRSPTCELSKSL